MTTHRYEGLTEAINEACAGLTTNLPDEVAHQTRRHLLKIEFTKDIVVAAKDIYHQTVIDSLEKAGWTITHDPLELRFGNRRLKVDLGAERLVGAEKDSQKIAVEIKSFLSDSAIYDLENAVGQYNIYREILAIQEPERLLYLAIPHYSYAGGIFSEPLGRLIVERQQLLLIVFDDDRKEIIKWEQSTQKS